MKEVFIKIEQTKDQEDIFNVMDAVRKWYALNYPEWDIFYAALHKDPELRKEELDDLVIAIQKDLRWDAEQWELRKREKTK